MIHTAGSRSFGQHLKKMEEEYKRPISYGELYNKVHKRKDGQYVSNKAKSFIESYENAMTEKYREDTSKHPIVDSGVWIKTGGENRKGRIYGIGHSLDLGIGPHVSSSTVEGPSSQNLNPTAEEITTLTTQISNLQE